MAIQLDLATKYFRVLLIFVHYVFSEQGYISYDLTSQTM